MANWINKLEPVFIEALEKRDVKKMRELFETIPTVDLAIFASRIEDKSKLTFIFKTIKSELTADFFTELDDETQESLLNVFTDNELMELINKSYSDDIVDVLEDLPANLVNRALKVCPKDKRETLNKLLNYKEDTAGSIMTTEYIELKNNITVEEAMKLIREKGKQAETIYTIFLRDDKRNLVGTADLDDLIFADPKDTLDKIKNQEFIYVKVDTDQEEVARRFKKYDLNAIAVVNSDVKLVGVITVDDVMDVIEQETNEDIALQTGLIPLKDEYEDISAWKMALKCAPWLIVLIIVGILSSLVISKFEAQIAKIVVLAAFIPVIMDTGGNAGGQTCGVIIRALALKEYTKKDVWRTVGKEILTAIFTGLIVGVCAFGVFLLEMIIPGIVSYRGATISQKCMVAGIVSLTLFFAIVISKFVACCLPFIAKKLNKDPALTSQPFVTTIVDFSSLLIYFGIVSLILYINPNFFNI